MKRLLFIVVPLLALVLFGMTANASDHVDAPSLVDNRAADIGDGYAFRSPEHSDRLVVGFDVDGATAPAELHNFAAGVEYNINVDTDGDLNADKTITVTFSSDLHTLKVDGLGNPIAGDVTPPGSAEARVTETNGISVFAGPRYDPFFQDAGALFGFLAAPHVLGAGFRRPGEPAFQNLSFGPVSFIVLELPITRLTGGASSDSGVIRVWFSTSRGGAQLDRMAIPDNSNTLMPGDQKEAFNRGEPATDAANFQPIARSRIEKWRTGVDLVLGPEDGGPLGNLTPAQAATALIPDVLTIDFSKPIQFPNGRRLQDDASDIAVGIVLNRGGADGMSDAVDGSDVPFLTSFPYVAPLSGSPSVSGAPNTGTNGPTGTAGTPLWLMLAGSVAGIALLASGLALRTRTN